jgi:hypothetical protein
MLKNISITAFIRIYFFRAPMSAATFFNTLTFFCLQHQFHPDPVYNQPAIGKGHMIVGTEH